MNILDAYEVTKPMGSVAYRFDNLEQVMCDHVFDNWPHAPAATAAFAIDEAVKAARVIGIEYGKSIAARIMRGEEI